MRTLEAESIVSIAESKGGCVKLETVTERQDGAVHMICLQQRVFTLNSLQDLKPVKRLKQKSDVVSFTFFRDEVGSTILSALNEGYGQRKQEFQK